MSETSKQTSQPPSPDTEEAPQNTLWHYAKQGAAAGLVASLAISAANKLPNLIEHHEPAGVTAEQQGSTRFEQALDFYRFLNTLKPGELTDNPSSRFQRVVVLKGGQVATNPMSPVKVDVAGQIVYDTQTLANLTGLTGDNPQDARVLMELYKATTTPETRELLKSEGIHVSVAEPSANGLGASGVDQGLDNQGKPIYNVEFITPPYSQGGSGATIGPQVSQYRDRLASFQAQIAPQG